MQRRLAGTKPVNDETRCGGNALIPGELSHPFHRSYMMDGYPDSGPYDPPGDPHDLSGWHNQDRLRGQFEQDDEDPSIGELSQLQFHKRLEIAAGRDPLEFEVPRNSFYRPVPHGWEACSTSTRSEPMSTGWCYCSTRVALFYPAECKLPWCCRATAVPNEGWLAAMAREEKIYFSSD